MSLLDSKDSRCTLVDTLLGALRDKRRIRRRPNVDETRITKPQPKRIV
jgi:hypothetical protein